MKLNFCFTHVGNDLTYAGMLVESIQMFHPDAEIIQLTDEKTPMVKGANKIFRFDFDASKLMSFRLKANAATAIEGVTVYLDTDMLLIRTFPFHLFEKDSVYLLERSFNRNVLVPKYGKGNGFEIDLAEHQGKTVFQMHPYIACFQVMHSNVFWKECEKALDTLNEKYHFWYGDQEIIRDVSMSERFKEHLFKVSEAQFACLPEFHKPDQPIVLLHFKGKRKTQMKAVLNQLKS